MKSCYNLRWRNLWWCAPPSPLRSSLAIFKRKIPLQFHQYEILVATATYDFIWLNYYYFWFILSIGTWPGISGSMRRHPNNAYIYLYIWTICVGETHLLWSVRPNTFSLLILSLLNNFQYLSSPFSLIWKQLGLIVNYLNVIYIGNAHAMTHVWSIILTD